MSQNIMKMVVVAFSLYFVTLVGLHSLCFGLICAVSCGFTPIPIALPIFFVMGVVSHRLSLAQKLCGIAQCRKTKH